MIDKQDDFETYEACAALAEVMAGSSEGDVFRRSAQLLARLLLGGQPKTGPVVPPGVKFKTDDEFLKGLT